MNEQQTPSEQPNTIVCKKPSVEEQIGDILLRLRKHSRRLDALEIHTHDTNGKAVMSLKDARHDW